MNKLTVASVFRAILIFRGGQTLDEEGAISSRDWSAPAEWASQSNTAPHLALPIAGAHTTTKGTSITHTHILVQPI